MELKNKTLIQLKKNGIKKKGKKLRILVIDHYYTKPEY